MAKKELKVTKSHELTQANFSEFSLSSYRVFEHILAKLQHYDCNKNLIHVSLAQRECTLSASEYAKEFGIGKCNVYALLKSAVDQLMKTSYSMKIDNKILKINVCSQAEYCSETGTIDIRFTEEIMPHIAGLAQKFTMYKLNDIVGLDSIYSTRLYELLMQWKTKGELRISVKDLRFTLGCVNKFNMYNDFKRFTFDHAANEISSKFDINLSYKEIKTGRAVTDIIFKFKAIQIQEFYDVFLQRKRTKVKSFKRKADEDLVKCIHPNQQDLFKQ